MDTNDIIGRFGWEMAVKYILANDHHRMCMCSSTGSRSSCTHSWAFGDRRLIIGGRCPSGSRWFWVLIDDPHGKCIRLAHGRVDTEFAVVEAIAGHLRSMPGNLVIHLAAAYASQELKELNADARAARIAAKPPSDDTSAAPIEYLHALERSTSDAGWIPDKWVRYEFRITRKTAKRIYYTRPLDRGEGFVDRVAIERDGNVRNRGRHWCEPDYHLHLEPPPIPTWERYQPDISELRQAVKDAAQAVKDTHPDRGGVGGEAFEAANAQLQAAKAELAVAR